MPEGIVFSDRFHGISGSAIREIFKMIAKPDMISFAGGNPAPSALPDTAAAEIAARVLKENGKQILQYGATEGYPPLLKASPPILLPTWDSVLIRCCLSLVQPRQWTFSAKR